MSCGKTGPGVRQCLPLPCNAKGGRGVALVPPRPQYVELIPPLYTSRTHAFHPRSACADDLDGLLGELPEDFFSAPAQADCC